MTRQHDKGKAQRNWSGGGRKKTNGKPAKPRIKPRIPPRPEKAKAKVKPKIPPMPEGAKTTAAPEEALAADEINGQAQTVNQLEIDLTILRSFPREEPTTPGNIARILTMDKDDVRQRFMALHDMRLLTRPGLNPEQLALSKKGKQLLSDSAGVDLASEELTTAVQSIQANLSISAGTKAAIEEVKLRQMYARDAIGTTLSERQATMPHGLWRIWLRYNFAMSVKTAERLMAFSEWLKASLTTLLADSNAGPRAKLASMQAEWRRLYGNKLATDEQAAEEEQASVNKDEVTPAAVTDGDDTTADAEAESAEGQGEATSQEENGGGGQSDEHNVYTVNLRFTPKQYNWWQKALALAKERYETKLEPEAAWQMAKSWVVRIGNAED